MDRERRDDRRDDGRREMRDYRARQDRDRSRSPPNRSRYDRRDRSPLKNAPRGPSDRYDRDRDAIRGRGRLPSTSPPPSRRPGDHGSNRQVLDSKSSNVRQQGRPGLKQRSAPDMRMQNGPEDEDSEAEMERLMGFKSFRTTKDTKVPGNDKNYAVNKVKKTEYRQYMNRVGGFNRPLSPARM